MRSQLSGDLRKTIPGLRECVCSPYIGNELACSMNEGWAGGRRAEETVLWVHREQIFVDCG